MRYSILGFNQALVMETQLDLTDLVLLQYIMQANGSPDMKHKVMGYVSYVWLSHSKIHEDLPILGISEGTLRNRLNTLKQEGWIMSITDKTHNGSLTYYSVTSACMSLINDVPTDARNSKMTCACNSKMTSDSKLEDSKLDNISKDIVEEPSVEEVPKKKNLYEKCVDAVNEHTADETLQNALIEFLTVRLANKDKPMHGVAQWKALLKKLDTLKGDKVKIVLEATANGWASFYEISNHLGGNKKYIYGSDTNVFGETDKTLNNKKMTKEEREELMSGTKY